MPHTKYLVLTILSDNLILEIGSTTKIYELSLQNEKLLRSLGWGRKISLKPKQVVKVNNKIWLSLQTVILWHMKAKLS